MKNDIRYSEFVFLRGVAEETSHTFSSLNSKLSQAVGLSPSMYIELAATLLEELFLRFENDQAQTMVARLRGELLGRYLPSVPGMTEHDLENPRDGLVAMLSNARVQRLRITYRGMRRIEELRDLLKADRILEPFGVLLSMQYFRRDLEDSLKNNPNTPVSVIYADMDNFKRINTDFGQSGGDVVMKAYLEAARDGLGLLGEGYRGVGDEVSAIVVGQGHERVVEIAEDIRKRVETMRCEYKNKELPRITASIGVAISPPESRTVDIENFAQDRKQKAKDAGKNRVIAK